MKKSITYLSMLGVFIVTSAVFIALFFYREAVVPNIAKVFDKNAPPVFSHLIYGGFAEESLNKPMDIAVINQFVYVTDTNNKRVQVFDLGGSQIFKFGSEGEGPGKFKFPYGITGDKQGNVYVSDLYNGNISIHDSKGTFIKYFAEANPKEKTIEAPGSIRIFEDKLYVADIQKSKILVFDMDGKKVKEIGEPGTKNGQFRAPNAVTIGRDGNIYVVDTGNQRVQVFDKEGSFIRILNGTASGSQESAFVNPRGIAVDSRGVVYVVSNLTHLIYGIDSTDGKTLFTFGGNGESNTQFALPNGLFVDENDQVYITDSMNARVSVYK